jgi:hypothetical protein
MLPQGKQEVAKLEMENIVFILERYHEMELIQEIIKLLANESCSR